MHISTWENQLRYGIIYSTAWSSLHLQMQDKLGLAGTLESASEGNVEREELKGLWQPSKREFQRLLKYFSPLASAWASVEVQQTLGSRRMKNQIHSSQPWFGGRCWNAAGIALWIGELFNHSTACQDQFCNCLAVQSMSFFLWRSRPHCS